MTRPICSIAVAVTIWSAFKWTRRSFSDNRYPELVSILRPPLARAGPSNWSLLKSPWAFRSDGRDDSMTSPIADPEAVRISSELWEASSGSRGGIQGRRRRRKPWYSGSSQSFARLPEGIPCAQGEREGRGRGAEAEDGGRVAAQA